MLEIKTLSFPKNLKIYHKKNSSDMINVPVEFRHVKSTTSNSSVFNDKNIYFLNIYKCFMKKFGENFFQIISGFGTNKKMAISDFWIDVGRAISVGDMCENKGVYSVGGLLSNLFNAEIDINGNVIYKNKKYKIIILYASTTFHNKNNDIIFLDSPSIVINKGLCFVRGKFSVILEH